MLKKTSERLLKISAYISLALGVLSVAFILLIAVLLYVSKLNMNLSKLFVVNIIFIIIAVAVFFFFFGIYEFLRHIIVVEKELEQVEEEIKGIEEKTAK
jgi:ABC-type nickel/cobalt efflux system permease component RcnA